MRKFFITFNCCLHVFGLETDWLRYMYSTLPCKGANFVAIVIACDSGYHCPSHDNQDFVTSETRYLPSLAVSFLEKNTRIWSV